MNTIRAACIILYGKKRGWFALGILSSLPEEVIKALYKVSIPTMKFKRKEQSSQLLKMEGSYVTLNASLFKKMKVRSLLLVWCFHWLFISGGSSLMCTQWVSMCLCSVAIKSFIFTERASLAIDQFTCYLHPCGLSSNLRYRNHNRKLYFPSC